MTDTRTPLQRAIAALAARRTLTADEAAAAFGDVMRGEATPAQVGALLLGLRVRGETADELAGAARALRDAMVRVAADGPHLIDTCGTGGGAVSTFNISTAAALVAAGAGATVAKHGNRSFTSACGSADVLEALGIRILHDASGAARVLQACRITFLFAPQFHPAVKHVAPVRRELGVTTLMNLIGPLANPAGVSRQVIGVADPDRAPVAAEALRQLGAVHALVVHGRSGLDEISPHGSTDVWEVRGETITQWTIDPAIYRLGVDDVATLRGGAPPENAARIEGLVAGGTGDEAGTAATLLNAGAAIYVAGLAVSYAEGIGRARHVLASGAARAVLDKWRKASVSIS
jgi:anthranilate phosphoribosyltransferase